MNKQFSVALTAFILCTAAAGQNIGWKPVTPGNMQWANTPGSGTTIYRQVGPLTFGSDGSRSYNTGDTPAAPGGRSGGNPAVLGETVYLRDSAGKPVACKRYGDNVFCD
ncbi:hypothetical protein [Ramlibacter sp. AN1133]|uniref:hypothetical protein n=1 Tax=Ramlibacter sp. AN1133 TaxID=3133429 RepID=UPI0030C5E04D